MRIFTMASWNARPLLYRRTKGAGLMAGAVSTRYGTPAARSVGKSISAPSTLTDLSSGWLPRSAWAVLLNYMLNTNKVPIVNDREPCFLIYFCQISIFTVTSYTSIRKILLIFLSLSVQALFSQMETQDKRYVDPDLYSNLFCKPSIIHIFTNFRY